MELVGTNEADDIKSFKSTIVDVKEIIKRMEKTIVVNNNFRPRIIESGCIEKNIVALNKTATLNDPSDVNNVTVNNKIIIADQERRKARNNSEERTSTIKVNRNKNVDLAFTMKVKQTKKHLLEKNTVADHNNEIEDLPPKTFQQDSNNNENVKVLNNENPYEKHYVLNDNRVLRKSNYEIEFEEFEIYDPVKKPK